MWFTDTKLQGSVNNHRDCVWQPWEIQTRESVITGYSYGMWLVDGLRYVTQWVDILITYTHVCMLYVHLYVKTYSKVHSVALGLDLVSWKFDSVKVHMALSITMKS